MRNNYFYKVLIFISVTFLSSTFVSYADITSCPGKLNSITISWSAGAQDCRVISTKPACQARAPTNQEGLVAGSLPTPVTVLADTPFSTPYCTATLTCNSTIQSVDNLNWDPSQIWDGSSCIAAIGTPSTPSNSTITLPNRNFTANFAVANGAQATCQLLASDLVTVLDSGPCSNGSLSGQTPNGAGTYTYYVRAVRASTGESRTSAPFTVTVNAAAVICAATQYWNGSSCTTCGNGGCANCVPNTSGGANYNGCTCTNGNTNVPACTTGAPDVCGPAAGTIQNPNLEPTGAQACSSGVINSSSPADTIAAWNWTCGTRVCTAPKWGCTVTTDTNYIAGGANNIWQCANTCANGNTNYSTCTTGGPIANLTVPASNPTAGTNFNVNYSGTNAGSCALWRSTISGSFPGGTGAAINTSGAQSVNQTDNLAAGTYYYRTICYSGGSFTGTASAANDKTVTVAPTIVCPATQYWNGSSCTACSPTGCNSCNVVTTGGQNTNGCVCNNLNTNVPACTTGAPLPTGTLISTDTCTILNGNLSCDVGFTWTTTNPVATSQVVGDGGGPSSASVNNGTQTLAVRYNAGASHIFRLYHNAVSIAQKGVVAQCASGSAWSAGAGSCQPCGNGGCTNNLCNNLSNNPPLCTLPGATLTANVAPLTVSAGGTSRLTYTTGGGATSFDVACPSAPAAVQTAWNRYGTLPLGTNLTFDVTSTAAMVGSHSCYVQAYNGQVGGQSPVYNFTWIVNPASCPATQYWNGSACTVCGNGGCSTCNPVTTGGANYNGCTCTNGNTNVPLCTTGGPTAFLSSNKASVVRGELFEVTATGGGNAQSCRLTQNSNGGAYGIPRDIGTSYTWGAVNGNSFSFSSPATIGYRLICYTNNNHTGISSTPYDVQVTVTECSSGSTWNGNSCQACANGGCTNNICNNGAADAPVCTHRSPTMGVLSCPAPGNLLTINWTNPNGYTHSYVRINSGPLADWSAACAPAANPPNGVCTSVIPNTDTYSMASTPTQRYSGLIYASVDATGSFYGDPTAFNNVYCTPPIPTPSLTLAGPRTTPSGANNVVSFGVPLTLTWGAVLGATSCNIKTGGGQDVLANANVVGGSTIINPGSAPFSAENTSFTFVLNCSGLWGPIPVTDTVGPLLFPPPPRVPVPTIATTDEKVTLRWTSAGAGYNDYEVLLYNWVAGTTGALVSATDITGVTATLSGTVTNSTYKATIRTKAGNGAVSNFISSPVITGRSINLFAEPSVITSIASPGAPINVGSLVKLESLIRNTGSVTPGTFSNFFQISSGPNGSVLPPINLAPVAMTLVSSSATTTRNYTFPTSGTFSVRACADFTGPGTPTITGEILETDESTNCSVWRDVIVTSPPIISINPVGPLNMRVGEAVDFTSNASDTEGDLNYHNFDVRSPAGVWYWSPYGGVTMAGIAQLQLISGEQGFFVVPRANNTYVMRLVPLKVGTYLVQAATRDVAGSSGPFIGPGPVTINVTCALGEWFSIPLNSCQKPLVSVESSCTNGAVASSPGNTCDICPIASVYIDNRCVAGGACVGDVASLVTTKCGNSIVESGEECDGGPNQAGIFGLSDPGKQKCTRSCTITCRVNTPDGSPSCGAGIGRVSLAGIGAGVNVSQIVKACTNGALQSSAPTCKTCAIGETYAGGICVAAVCGDGVKNEGEQCDGLAGVVAGKTCTTSCCLVNTPPPLPPVATLPSYTMTCSGADSYKITRGGTPVEIGAVRYEGAYTVPVVFQPNVVDTYVYTCFAASDPTAKDETTRAANLPPAIPPVVQSRMILNASQKSISKNSSVAISWITPAPDVSCKIMFGPVITRATRTCDASCIAERQREAKRLTSEFYFGYTDTNDAGNAPAGTPRLMSIALTTKVGVTSDSSGKKTVQMKYSNIIYGSCSNNSLVDPGATKLKIKVAEDSEE